MLQHKRAAGLVDCGGAAAVLQADVPVCDDDVDSMLVEQEDGLDAIGDVELVEWRLYLRMCISTFLGDVYVYVAVQSSSVGVCNCCDRASLS